MKCFDQTHREPVNKLAALQCAKGVKREIGPLPPSHSAICPPIHGPVAMRKMFEGKCPEHHGVNLTGTRFGRFTVIGMARLWKKKDRALWVARCACGMYETRSARAVKNARNVDDCCEQCRKVKVANFHHERRVRACAPLGGRTP